MRWHGTYFFLSRLCGALMVSIDQIVQTLELQSWSQILVHRVCLNFLCKQFLPYCLKVCFFPLLYLKTELNCTLWGQISHWYLIKRLHRASLFTILLNFISASLHHPCFGQIERLWDPSKWLPTREAPVSTLWICIFYQPTFTKFLKYWNTHLYVNVNHGKMSFSFNSICFPKQHSLLFCLLFWNQKNRSAYINYREIKAYHRDTNRLQ